MTFEESMAFSMMATSALIDMLAKTRVWNSSGELHTQLEILLGREGESPLVSSKLMIAVFYARYWREVVDAKLEERKPVKNLLN